MPLSLRYALPAAVLFGTGAMAESFGTITADYGGESRQWHTITLVAGGTTAASATFDAGRMLSELHLQGHPRPAYTTTDVLSIDVSYRSPYTPGATPMIIEIIHLPEGMSGPIWTTDRAPTQPKVSFETLDLESDTGRAIGSFEATLCFVESLYAEPDLDRCKPIVGSFETNVLIE